MHKSDDWRADLAAAYSSPQELLAALGLTGRAPQLSQAASFPLRVPRSYVARMRYGDPDDPLLRQVLPLASEDAVQPGFSSDPVGEQQALRAAGLLHKYRGRALLVTTAACPVHCRYCFRREYPYSQGGRAGRWNEALAAIAADESIDEVLLSGGDPLSLGNARLATLTRALEAIPHVRRLRLHTRAPVVLPSRVDTGLQQWLRGLRWPTVIVLHANHPNEIDAEVSGACARLRDSGVTLLNQSVLLRGVNDSAQVLCLLSTRLFEAGVLPYYLHALDRVRGAAHFEVDEVHARSIAGELARLLPGYLVPRLVREVAGAPAKVPLAPLL